MAWMNTDAINKVSCPRCGEQPGNSCRSPSGTIYASVHAERTIALRNHPDFNLNDYRMTATNNLDQIFKVE